MNSTVANPGGALEPAHGSEPPSPAPVDALRLQAQCARAIEEAAGLRPLLEMLRRLFNAHVVAWLESPALPGRWPDVIVGTRPGQAPALVALRATLDPQRARGVAASALGADCYTISAPIEQEGVVRGWLVAQLPVRNPRDLQAFLVLLQMAGGYVLYGEQRRATAGFAGALERASGLLEIFRVSGAELDFEKACRGAVDALRQELGSAQVHLAFREHRRLRLQAISGVARLDWKSVAHRPVEAAMREALSAQKPIDWTPDSPCLPATAAHELLAQETGATRLLTLPLAGGRGALLFRWKDAASSQPDRAIAAAAAFMPMLFELLQRARPHPLIHGLRHGWENLKRRQRQTILGGSIMAAAVLAFPFPYHLSVGCRLAPVTKQVVAAPFQAQLKRSLVRPGDRVDAGQTLGELDSRELKLKESELLAARERALKTRDRAMANQGEGSDFAAAQVANLEAQSVGQDLALVQSKLAMLNVVSPLAGTVVSGDLRRAEGQPIQQGQVLWEVAPLDEMIAELEVPDRDISLVHEGQRLRVRLESFGSALPVSAIQRLHPQSEPSDGQNIFVCEAPVRTATLELRPGMRGRATIETGHQPLAWILGHRLWEWVVTTLFWS